MIKLIYAASINNIIGRNNRLPWYLPYDIKRFKALTENHVVVMGRKTWESLPLNYKPLSNRINVVLSSNKELNIEGVIVVDNIETIINNLEGLGDKDIYFIGGERVLTEAMEYADEIYLTSVNRVIDGDVKGPSIDHSKWIIRDRSDIMRAGQLEYQFLTHCRK
jgi:dihydrofolate reductase